MNDETTVRQLLNRALNSSLLSGDELQFLCGIDFKLRSESPLNLTEAEFRRLADILDAQREREGG